MHVSAIIQYISCNFFKEPFQNFVRLLFLLDLSETKIKKQKCRSFMIVQHMLNYIISIKK